MHATLASAVLFSQDSPSLSPFPRFRPDKLRSCGWKRQPLGPCKVKRLSEHIQSTSKVLLLLCSSFSQLTGWVIEIPFDLLELTPFFKFAQILSSSRPLKSLRPSLLCIADGKAACIAHRAVQYSLTSLSLLG